MRRHWNNKGKIIFLSGLFALCSSLLFALCLILPDRASSGPYLDSAHGGQNGTTTGVQRTSVSDYAAGNCVHCHEQHASIGGQTITPQKHVLFYGYVSGQAYDTVCCRCHQSVAPEQEVLNYLYSINFGGLSSVAFAGIYNHFFHTNVAYANCGSRHHLLKIYNIIKDNGQGWGYGSDPTPCEACHNVHLAQRIGATQYHGPYDPNKSPIQRVTEHNDPTKRLNLWGDDASERMDQYASSVGGHYLAPYYGSVGNPTTGPFEPAGDSTKDGSNLPDYVTFCMDCHQYAQYDPERSLNVKAIEWGPPWSTSLNADIHGAYAGGGYWHSVIHEQGNVRAPYDDDDSVKNFMKKI